MSDGGSDIGLIGLAVMGQNLVLNMADHGFRVIAYNRSTEKTRAFVDPLPDDSGISGAETLEELVDGLASPRKIMMMVRAGGAVDAVIDQLVPLLDEGDVLIDGGNSNFPDTQRRAEALAEKGLLYVGTGVSGGEEGARHGPSLMPGGHPDAWPLIKDIFQSIAAKTEDGSPCCDWVGEGGAGHFVKMVHNGIEYGLMAAIGEGLNVLAKANIGRIDHDEDAETAPLEHAEYYQYDIDLAKVTEVWRRGSVISSWLLDLTAEAYHTDPDLDAYDGHVSDSGEGRWTISAAIDEGVPVPVLSAALYQRFSSRGRSDVADKTLSAMRAGFGGHVEKKDSTR